MGDKSTIMKEGEDSEPPKGRPKGSKDLKKRKPRNKVASKPKKR